MLRALVLVLVLANGLFFGWARGWFAPGWPAPGQAGREPHRLTAQIEPARVTVLAPPAAGPGVGTAVGAPGGAGPVCLEAGPLTDADLPGALAAIEPAGLPAGAWMQDTPPVPSADGGASGTAAQPTASGPTRFSETAAVQLHWLRVPSADPATQTLLRALTDARLVGGFKPCTTRP